MADKKIMAFLLIALLFAFTGCTTSTTSLKPTGTNTIVTTDDGNTVTVTGTAGEDSWCPEGGDWKFASNGPNGDAKATWKVDKIMTSGKYSGLCHVIYTANDGDTKVNMDYYFSENGKSGYYVMDVNGQKFEQTWEGE